MSVEKTLHVQVIYIQGHFSMEWQVKEEQWDKEVNRVKNKNSSFGAKRHAAWAKITSPTSAV